VLLICRVNCDPLISSRLRHILVSLFSSSYNLSSVVARSLSVGDPDQKLVTPTISASRQVVSAQVCRVITPPSSRQYLCIPLGVRKMRVYHCHAAMLSPVFLHTHWSAKHARLLSSSGTTQTVRIRFRIFRYTLSSHSYIILPSRGEPLALKLFCPDPSYTFSALCPGSFRDGSSPAYTLLSGFGVVSAAQSVASVARRKAVKLMTRQKSGEAGLSESLMGGKYLLLPRRSSSQRPCRRSSSSHCPWRPSAVQEKTHQQDEDACRAGRFPSHPLSARSQLDPQAR
jgi:hypothetical protein